MGIPRNILSSSLLLAALLSGIIALGVPKTAAAVSGSEFNAGRIIDDSIFFDSGTMTVADIQNFLNAKVPTCDTQGSQIYSGSTTRGTYGTSRGYPPPYTCLKSFSESVPARAPETGLCNGIAGGNKTSAQIVYEVAQSCGVNPRILLVMLQKEQGLVTDDWPWSIQYRSATGYGCPDTAPCDSDYYGFFNQVYVAARAFKYYAAHPADFNYRAGHDNFILYNPNTACGGANVFIQNQATANLYIYTPYQPNQAALNNLNGLGDSCSSYGIRNFWTMFHDWFGYTNGPGYEFVDAINPPSIILPNDVVHADIRIRNRTGTTWYGDGHVPAGQHAMRLAMFGYQNNPYGNPADPNWLGTRNQLRMQESSVPDGGVATFNLTYKAPFGQVNGYFGQFVPVFDGAGFLPYIGLSFTTSTPTPVYGYSLVSSTGINATLPTNFTQAASYTVKNTGNIVWWNESNKPIGAAPLRLFTVGPSYHTSVFYDSSSWLANNQVALTNGRVWPGEQGTFNFNIKTPAANGTAGEWFGLMLDGATPYPYDTQLSWIMNVADYSFTPVSTDIPAQLVQGQKYTAKVIVKNTGVGTWYADGNTPQGTNPVRLMTAGYRPYPLANTDSSMWIGNNQVKMTTAQVAPGQNAEFDFDIIAPYTAVASNFNDFRIVLDGLMIMPGSIQAPTTVPARSGSYTTVTGGVYPALTPLSPGQVATGKLVVKNNTNFVWYSDSGKPSFFRGGSLRIVMNNPYYRASPFGNLADTAWLNTTNQITMSTPVVNPGENAEFTYTWKAPATPGSYTDHFGLVLDGYQILPDIGMQIVTKVQ